MSEREKFCSDCGVSFDEVDRRGGMAAINGGHDPGCARVTRYNESVDALRSLFGEEGKR